jgi:hypothetical protein
MQAEIKKKALHYKKTTDLIPYINNSRTHSEEQILQIAASIKEFGFTNPVLLDSDNGIIAGHGRAQAALKLNLDKIPCIILEGLTEAQKKAYVIADNKLALNAGWNEEVLIAELNHLKEIDFNIDLAGFNDKELFNLFTLNLGEPTNNNAYEEWQGMPEYENKDISAFKTILVHMNDQKAVDDFASLIDQKITEKTKMVWYPFLEIETYKDKEYIDEK